MPVRFVLLLAALVAVPAAAPAQSDMIPPGVASASSKALFDVVTGFIIRSAEKMPEEHYAWKPTPDVRSYAQLLGHVADAQYFICSSAIGEKPPATEVEKTRSGKAELIKALGEAFAYCNRAHATLAGPAGAEIMDGIGGKHPRVGALYFNTMHTFEHYGNVITYLRLKGIVPPSSEPRQGPSAQ